MEKETEDKDVQLYIHTMEYYCTMKGMKYWHTTTMDESWAQMLSKIRQLQRQNTLWFHLYGVPRVVKFHKDKVELLLPGAEGRGKRSWCLMGRRF